jgi:hypothetical protein
MSGCKARNIKVSEENACNLYDTSSKFRTPILSIPDNSILSLTAFPGALGTYYSWLEGVR